MQSPRPPIRLIARLRVALEPVFDLPAVTGGTLTGLFPPAFLGQLYGRLLFPGREGPDIRLDHAQQMPVVAQSG